MSKDTAIIKVLTQRGDHLRRLIPHATVEDAIYFQGKLDGYEQAIELLNDNEESISVELNDEQGQSNDLEEAANKFAVSYDQGTCDGIAQECFKAGAEWYKAKMMEGSVEGTLEGQLLKSLTEDGKKMIISVPRAVFPSKPTTRKIRVIIVKEDGQ